MYVLCSCLFVLTLCGFACQVLGSNFQLEYELNLVAEKQRKKDVCTSIKIGLLEFREQTLKAQVVRVLRFGTDVLGVSFDCLHARSLVSVLFCFCVSVTERYEYTHACM